MKQMNRPLAIAAVACTIFLANGCNSNQADTSSIAIKDSTEQTTPKADPGKLKAEIQELESAWAAADNARDANTVAAFYADDAVSLENNGPIITGNAAIKKDLEQSYAKRAKGSTLSFEVMDAFGCENYVTEVGKTTVKDSTGKVDYTAKYMALWEKRNGKWICIRDISNRDAKEK